MTDPFIKHFDDRYTQSREYQFLDLLNQLHVAVPAVISNESLQGFIKMEHVGVNLNEWLLTIPEGIAGQALAFNALHQAVDISSAVAKKDVWHFDLAARNFMVEQPSGLATPKVRLIDFSLAISKRFPLEKPLWMRPDKTQQHPALVAALQADWESFFNRHNLASANFDAPDFEIPMPAYQADWGSGLAADQITLLWCVVSHSIGNMLAQAAQCACFGQGARQQLGIHANKLMNLSSETAAQTALENVQLWMQSQVISLTPRPSRKFDQQTSTGGVPKAAAQAPSAPKAAPAVKVDSLGLEINTHPISTIPVAKTLAAAVLGGLAYALIDTIYLAYQVRVSDYTVGAALVIGSISVLLLLGLLISERRKVFVSWLSKAHGLAICAFALEMWAQRVPDPWVIGVAFVGSILLIINYQ